MDEQIWFYIIAAVIYFLTRKKKKPVDQPSTPDTSSSERPQQRKPVSFEDLLKEITEQRQVEEVLKPVDRELERSASLDTTEENIRNEGRNRQFADEESLRVYQESVRQAEGAELEFAPSENFASERLFKGKVESKEPTFADEIREGFGDPDSARKAIIYSEILSRKY